MAPPRQDRLDQPTVECLTALTAELLASRPDSAGELQRYLSVGRRGTPLPEREVAAALRGRTVVVTGGSGYIGTVLLRQIRRLCAARLVSLDIAAPRRPVAGVEYANVDVRSAGAVAEFFDRYPPDIVFHLAAQRDPGLAERYTAYTVDTNVLGTFHVANAAERAGAGRFVYASTGKALRPYSRCVYTESKRLGEWLVADVARRGRMACTGGRFTHVVDNSIVLDRMRRWRDEGGPIRLHSPDMVFYVQSAVESAQLLLAALLSPADGGLRMHAIRDLGWPVNLLDLALGFVAGSDRITPLYLAGCDPGYEEVPYPGLYDPTFSGDVSPLLNAMEAHRARPSTCSGVDDVAVTAHEAPEVVERLPELRRWCEIGSERQVRRVLDELGRDLMTLSLRTTSPAILDRVARLTESHRGTMNEEHRQIDDVVRHYAGRTPAPAAAETGAAAAA
ncbi:NAD-dependent epimerase/dehydratase family protein [Planosporangium sp. 12N6]|uniref:NAD-dependent epimerase/dehydratase family protein n=1 Tax=Planosporangium spinosum TaxID=3402278 RepID=UPI003CFBB647